MGDRYVLEMLGRHGWMLGGESSGHIICRDRTTTGDGIISALQVLAAMVKSGMPLHDFKAGMRKYPQRMLNVPVAGGFDCQRSQVVQAAVRAVEAELGATGRVLLRPSGTEPVIRVMVEGEDGAQVDRLVQQLADAVSEAQQAATGDQACG